MRTRDVILGALVGLLISAVIVLRMFMAYVSSDMDGWRRWLDQKGTPA